MNHDDCFSTVHSHTIYSLCSDTALFGRLTADTTGKKLNSTGTQYRGRAQIYANRFTRCKLCLNTNLQFIYNVPMNNKKVCECLCVCVEIVVDEAETQIIPDRPNRRYRE